MQRIEYYTCGSRDEPEGLTLMTRVVNEDGTSAISYGEPSDWYKPQQITKDEYDALVEEMRTQSTGGVRSFGLLSPAQRERSRIQQRADTVTLWEMSNAGKIALAKQLATVLGSNAADVLVMQEPHAPVETLARIRSGEL